MKNKVFTVIAMVAVVLASVYFGFSLKTKEVAEFQDGTFGAAGNLLAENYIPYVMYNGGFNTAKSLKTTGDFTVGSSGTALTQVVSGTCTGTMPSSNFLASTTQQWICSDSTVVAGDKIYATLSKSVLSPSGPGLAFGFDVQATVATTSGFFGVSVANLTGTGSTTVDSTNRAINYLIVR